MLYGIAKPIAVALMRLTCGLEVRGREHVPALGPLLVVSNHVSVLDPPFVGGACPRELYYLAKEELFAVPLFGRLIHALNARPVTRDGSDGRALKAALKLLGENRARLLFPEGTTRGGGTAGRRQTGCGHAGGLERSAGGTRLCVGHGAGTAAGTGAPAARPRHCDLRPPPRLQVGR